MGVPPDKPLLLNALNQIDRFGVLTADGGLEDQPYQRMVELSWVDEIVTVRALQEKSRSKP